MYISLIILKKYKNLSKITPNKDADIANIQNY
jgi:hypothetical protein